MAPAMTAKVEDARKTEGAARVSAPSALRPLPQGDGAEEALAVRAAQGDTGAFDALVTLFSNRVFAVALRILHDRAEAEDLAQEVFVALYHSLGSFRGESKLSTWIYRITRNRCLNRLKFLKRRHVGMQADVDDPAVARALSEAHGAEGGAREAERRLDGAQLSGLLEHHLRNLPEEQRTLVILRDLEDLSYEEIAAITELPLGTVKSRLHRARSELARHLAPHFPADANPSGQRTP